MKIVSLTTENVKKISAITITPEGDMVVLGGNNGEGKSSILDSIMMALAGKKSICEKPLKEGAKKGKTELDLGKYVVTRTYTEAGGGTITVKNSDGAKYSSPQSILDGLTGDLTFDPVRFANLPGRDQLETLKKLVGLDFTELDEKYKRIYSERTDIGRDGKKVKARLDGMVDHGDVEPVILTEIVEQIQAVEKQNRENEGKRQELAQERNGLDLRKQAFPRKIQEYQNEIDQLEKKRADIKDRLVALTKELDQADEDRSKSIKELNVFTREEESALERLEKDQVKERFREAMLTPPIFSNDMVELAVSGLESKVHKIKMTESSTMARQQGDLEKANKILELKRSRENQVL